MVIKAGNRYWSNGNRVLEVVNLYMDRVQYVIIKTNDAKSNVITVTTEQFKVIASQLLSSNK